MPGNFKKEDIRVEKTNEALMEAIEKLVGLRNFNRITVNDLCVEARICKATFYYHFKDKYDLFEHWLQKIKSEILSESGTYKGTEQRIHDFVNNNGKIVKHLVEDANSETLGLICDFMLSLLEIEKTGSEGDGLKYFVLSRFCCGGITHYLQWQAANTSKTDSKQMDLYFYDILNTLYQWNAEHE